MEGTKKLVYSPTGPLNRDYDDVRRCSDAAIAGVKRLGLTISACLHFRKATNEYAGIRIYVTYYNS